jgi:hypothetical protein
MHDFVLTSDSVITTYSYNHGIVMVIVLSSNWLAMKEPIGNIYSMGAIMEDNYHVCCIPSTKS